MSLAQGQVLEGKYRIVRLIGEGGMGAVYEGENVRIQRRVAIKVVHPAFARNTEVVARFQREAQAAGRIGNDHILEVLDLGVLDDGSHFMVLEFLDGQTLSDRIKQLGRLTPQQTVAIGRQILQGLGAAHGAGIIHRDLKPDNIFILKEKAGTRDFVKIIDFGISKFQPLSGDGMKMTSTGAVMGTPYYMSPEQASGSRDADARSDLYSVGVILYECVTGRVPFDGETFNQLMFKIVLSEPPHPQSVVPDLDNAFTSIVLKSMARDVSQRFQSAKEFIEALQAWMDKGADVSVPPPPTPDALVPGATRRGLASTPGVAARSAPRSTGGSSWAKSQPGPTPARSTVALGIAGGVLLAAGALGAVLFLRRGAQPASSAEPPHASATAAASPAPVAPPKPPETVPAATTAPAVVPAPSAEVTPAPTSAAAVPATPKPGSAVHKPAPQAKPAGAKPHKAAAASGEDFGY